MKQTPFDFLSAWTLAGLLVASIALWGLVPPAPAQAPGVVDPAAPRFGTQRLLVDGHGEPSEDVPDRSSGTSK